MKQEILVWFWFNKTTVKHDHAQAQVNSNPTRVSCGHDKRTRIQNRSQLGTHWSSCSFFNPHI